MKLILTLFRHQWLSFGRSRNSGKSFVMQIFSGFIALYLLTMSFYAGIAMSAIIEKLAPGKDVVTIFCGFLLYYFSVDIIIRFMLQELPALTVQPYLIKNIKRKYLVRFLNIRSLFHFLNLVPLLLFIPFSLIKIWPGYGGPAAVSFIATVVLLVSFNHFLILYVKRKMILYNWLMVGFFLVVVIVGFCDYHGYFSIRTFSSSLFLKLLQMPWLAAISLLTAVAAFVNSNRYLYKNLYIEEMVKPGGSKSSAEYTWLNSLGIVGELISLDLKLILRNKRPRSLLLMSGLVLFYGFFFYKKESLANNQFGLMIVGAIFITGSFIISYGNYLFAWQSSHYDGLVAGRIKWRDYIKSKLMLFLIISTVCFSVSCLYGLISWKLVIIQFAAYLFNIGVVSVLTVYIATWNYKRLDIEKSASFNYQGTGLTQWIHAFLILLAPGAFYLPFALLIDPWAGIASLGIAGFASLLLWDYWVEILLKQFDKRKHLILAGFREK